MIMDEESVIEAFFDENERRNVSGIKDFSCFRYITSKRFAAIFTGNINSCHIGKSNRYFADFRDKLKW